MWIRVSLHRLNGKFPCFVGFHEARLTSFQSSEIEHFGYSSLASTNLLKGDCLLRLQKVAIVESRQKFSFEKNSHRIMSYVAYEKVKFERD